MSFNGKIALITGAGSGIGAGAAHHLASLGAKLSIVDINETNLQKTAAQIKLSGGKIPLQIVADVAKDSERIVRETIKQFEKIDILINCAGIADRDNSVCSVDLSKFNDTFNVNVLSVVTLTKFCVPHLEKTKGNIINVSSVCGLQAYQNMLTHCMSKAAIDQFTKCCALDLASKGIRVNAINPASIRTPLYGSPEKVEERANYCKQIHPISRIGEVTDTSAAIAFLASNQTGSFLTGVLLSIDGGFLTSGL